MNAVQIIRYSLIDGKDGKYYWSDAVMNKISPAIVLTKLGALPQVIDVHMSRPIIFGIEEVK